MSKFTDLGDGLLFYDGTLLHYDTNSEWGIVEAVEHYNAVKAVSMQAEIQTLINRPMTVSEAELKHYKSLSENLGTYSRIMEKRVASLEAELEETKAKLASATEALNAVSK